MTRSVSPWCLKRRTSLIRRIDNLWVGIGLPHWLNEKPVARLSCRPKRPAPPKGAHDRLKSLLTIPRNTCSRCSEIRAHDPAKRAPATSKTNVRLLEPVPDIGKTGPP